MDIHTTTDNLRYIKRIQNIPPFVGMYKHCICMSHHQSPIHDLTSSEHESNTMDRNWNMTSSKLSLIRP